MDDLKGWNLSAQLYDADGKPVFGKDITVTADYVVNEPYPQRDNVYYGMMRESFPSRSYGILNTLIYILWF